MKFSIRDLLWLTLVVALLTCWWLHVRSLQLRDAARAQEMYQEVLEMRKYVKDAVDTINQVNTPASAPNPALAPNSN